MAQSTEEVYALHHADAAALIQQLKIALFDLPAPDGDTAINWGHIGTVVELKRHLNESLAFLSNGRLIKAFEKGSSSES